MNKYSVNLSTVFTEVPFLDRFKKAREAGFSNVECQFPYTYVRLANQLLHEAGLSQFTGQLAEKAFQKAADVGLNDQDMSAVIKPLEETAGAVVKRKD
ncbi:hypothetical protein AF332_19295 [Sporosarcina globispora]|uniref:Uncharacterized protein n=1 Tax=Sporosarcina globispora TaxID=1459 RepID=A0A0M0GH04_SPOGL|nr:hypothetical protein AF332_19295 [Sporosarcina globispora]